MTLPPKSIKNIKILLLFAFMTIMVSCSAKIKEGEVYEKKYSPAHSVMLMMPITTTCGKTTTTRIIPMFFFYPNSWSISYQAFNKKENRWDKATVWCTKNIYDMTEIGTWYERTENDFDKQPRIRVKNKKGAN
jgi:hypothetical protein